MASKPPDLKKISDRALRLHQAGDLPEAERLYRQMLAAEPDSFTAHHALGIIRAQQGRNAEAIEWIGAALTLEPDVAPAWANHGNLLSAAGRLDEALASYDKALAIQPEAFEVLLNRARTLLDLQRLEKALRDYDAVLAISPDHVEALNDRGNILRSLKRFEEALASFNKALALGPGLAETLVNRGVTLSDLRRLEEALADYDAALAIKPDSAPALNNRGFTLRELGQLENALANYNKTIDIQPNYPAALNNRAKLLCEMDRIREGFADFSRAAAIVRHAASVRPVADEPPHKTRHDREQNEYLAESVGKSSSFAHGVELKTAAINRSNDPGAVAARWRTTNPCSVVIDNFLTVEALEGLRRFCWDNAIWRTVYSDGYLGAFPEQGFACPLLAQIADELRRAHPAIFHGYPLLYLWAFKYDSRLAGTAVHADEAAINVNFWITPDEANLDPGSGGLVIWDTKPPPDWDFARYNGEAGPIRDFLTRSGAKSITVPYRSNRAVIFDSDLFHQTDTIRFKAGYRNRRINVTLLYGRHRRRSP
ncbi:MAG TPA: tetratricopeptide repeat protein [Rhizomicrobium sp.]|jgi:tetratricopeptide (TPR) repeat protein|nr:tetratricopeptide repeat protein [Rhizomicrobium sp.]